MSSVIKSQPKVDISPVLLRSIYDRIQQHIDDIPSRIAELCVSEFAEKYRVLPRGTPIPGPWRNRVAPYLVEPMDCLSATSPIQELAFLKAAQVGVTAGLIENFIAYIIRMNPGPTMYVSATEAMLAKWVNKRLSALLSSCGLDGLIQAQNLIGGQKRSGNKQFAKEFPGGFLDMVTSNSGASLRGEAYRFVLFDEIDAYPESVGDEGDPVSIAEARTSNFGHRKKIVYVSTPLLADTSRITVLYNKMDRRKYHVPCPLCGERQILNWEKSDTEGGMQYKVVDGRLDEKSIRYACVKCGGEFAEEHKYKIVNEGEWAPTSRSYSGVARSYHIWSAYNLMKPWVDVVKRWIKTDDDPNLVKAFVNLELGFPFHEVGFRPQARKLLSNRGTYERGTVPDGVLFLTIGADVQRGKDNDPDNPPRIELEVLGHGIGYSTWSVDYKRFEGNVDDPFGGAWTKLQDWAIETGLRFKRHDGTEFSVAMIFIDSGYSTDAVYTFTQAWPNTFACKGASKEDVGRQAAKSRGGIEGVIDKHGKDAYRYYRPSKMGSGHIIYLVHGAAYKLKLYQQLEISRRSTGKQRRGFCDFPKSYEESYFKQLVAEERLEDKSFHLPKGRSNEALDCRVYAMCASHAWLDSQVDMGRKALIKNGAHPGQAQQMFTAVNVLRRLEQSLGKSQ